MKISDLAAEELEGKLETPPEHYLMPLAVISISIVTELRYDSAYLFQGYLLTEDMVIKTFTVRLSWPNLGLRTRSRNLKYRTHTHFYL